MKSHGLPRCVDAGVALLLLVAAAPVLGLIGLAVGATSSGPILFRHRRMGRAGQPFDLLKFRTMRAAGHGPEVTAKGDPRITPLGRILRRTKLDELPELWNVVRGDMALVGPRPEALQYAVLSNPLWQRVLSVRPGLTDAVTVQLRNEEELIAAAGPDHETFYRDHLLPYKLRACENYLATRTWKRDVAVLWHTAVAVVAPSHIAPPSRSEIIAGEKS
jgi:lipopolysaccharide/colanic/teichoic acid biosynthesis glycosyltransferase